MHKVNVSLIVATVILVILNIFQFFFWRNLNVQTAAKYTAEIATLEQKLASFGSEVTVYTVAGAVKAGDVVEDENIATMTMYSSLLTDQFVTDSSEITDRYFKIAVNPGTPITYNMVMDEELDDTARDRDIILDHHTVGLQPGDYIDIRMTMPYGDDYIVISHKRVQEINENTIKLYLTELEWNTYLGAMVDWALNAEYGCTLYADRYVEPGLQTAAVNFYAVPTNIAALLQKNPNIVNKEEAANLNEWRRSIEELLVIFRDEDDTVDADGSRFQDFRGNFNSAIGDDATTRKEEDAEKAQQEQTNGTDDEITDDYWESDVE